MRVLLIAPEFHPISIGGGGVVVKNLARGLESKGCSLTVISAKFNAQGFFDRPYATRSGKTEIIWLPLLPSPHVGFQLKSYLPPNIHSVSTLLRVFLKSDFDLVNVHGFGHMFCDFAALLSRACRKPYVYTIHGFAKAPKRRGGFLKKLYSIYTVFFGNLTVKRAARIVAVSSSLADECKARFPNSSITVIQNGIDPSCCEEPSAQRMKEVISRFRIKGKKVILCLGRIHEGKGFQYVIKSLPSVLEKDNQAHLVVAGEDDGFGYSDELSRFVDEYDVKSHVSFVGRVTDEEEKNALLWQASAIAIPSLEEAFGLVAVEAMGSGRLIVASRVGGLSEVLAKDEYSQLFEAGDVKALTDALIYALRNTDLQAKARANRFRRFGEFNMFRMTESYFNLYVSIINKSAKASKE